MKIVERVIGVLGAIAGIVVAVDTYVLKSQLAATLSLPASIPTGLFALLLLVFSTLYLATIWQRRSETHRQAETIQKIQELESESVRLRSELGKSLEQANTPEAQLVLSKVSNLGQSANNILDIVANWGILRIFLDEMIFLKSHMVKDISTTLLMSCLGAYYNNDLTRYKKIIDSLQINYNSNNDLRTPLRICGYLADYYRDLWDRPRNPAHRERMQLARSFEKEANETDSPIIKAICLNYAGLIWRHDAGTLNKSVPSEDSWQKSIDAFRKALAELDRTQISELDKEIWRALLYRNLGRSFLSLSKSEEGKKNLWSSLRAWETVLGSGPASGPAVEGITHVAVYGELSLVRLDLLEIGEPVSEGAVWLNETKEIIKYGDEFFPALSSLRAAYKQYRKP